MKYLLSILLVAISITSINAQEEKSEDPKPILERKHEVRLGIAKALSGGIIEGVYEYVQDSNRGFGAAVLLNMNNDNDYLENYSWVFTFFLLSIN
jgi:hypothetical protein